MADPAIQREHPKPRSVDLPDGGLAVHAPAKINLQLRVGPVRSDGFHPLDSFVARVSLYDRVELRPGRGGRGIGLRVDGADCGPPGDNLAVRAAELLLGRTRTRPGGLEIRLDKRIPPGMGLGGGSSDAAAVLEGLTRMWGLDVKRADLLELAARLGSDVPLFLGRPALRMTGRGEVLEPLAVHPFLAALVLPDLACGTGPVYRAFDALPAPEAGGVDAVELKGPPSAWREGLVNHLGAAARRVRPELGRLWDRLSDALGVPVHLTGSGAGLFVLADDAAELEGILTRIPADLAGRCVVVESEG